MSLDTPYQSLDDVVAGLSAQELIFRAGKDRRAVFLTVYVMMSRQMKRSVEEGQFDDNAWVGRYTVSFANLYRQALADFERGNLDAVPNAWRLSFQTSEAGTGLVPQDLLLGINAHINHDLALALNEVSIDPHREQRYVDHTAVNQVLRAVTEPVENRVSQLYAPGLAKFPQYAGQLDETVANFSIDVARENAWESAMALANARNELERQVVFKCLQARSAVLGRLILTPNMDPGLFAALRHVEQGTAWWEQVLG